MARKKNRRLRMPHFADLSLTPLIDTFATLLVIFMVAAPMAYNGIKVDLPQGKAKEVGQEQEFVVTLAKDGTLFFNSFPVERDQLTTAVRKALAGKEDMPVFVRADEVVSYGKVIEVVDTLKIAGVRYVAMTTRPQHG